MKSKSVFIRSINPTKKTVALTGLSSTAEIVKAKNTLFKEYSEEDLVTTYANLHNNKLAESAVEEYATKTIQEKREALVNTLRFQLTLEQEAVRVDENGNVTENANNNPILLFGLKGSGYGALSNNKKVAWTTFDLFSVMSWGIKDGSDFSTMLAEQGVEIYLQRLSTFKPEIRNGKIVSSPKRMGKGGSILLKNGKFIYQSTAIKFGENINTEQLQAEEIQNQIDFKHDDVLVAGVEDGIDNIPVETKDANGFFNDEFESFLHLQYVEQNEGMTKVA